MHTTSQKSRRRPAILAAALLASMLPHIASADTINLASTSDVGDIVNWSIDNVTAVLKISENPYTDTWSHTYPVPAYAVSYIAWRVPGTERYSVNATADPHNGQAGSGWYRVNELQIYVYEDFENYEMAYSRQWMPPGGLVRVQGTGKFIWDPMKLVFLGYNENYQIVRKLLVTINIQNLVDTAPYNYWGYGGGGGSFGWGGPPGGGDDWPPWPDDPPPDGWDDFDPGTGGAFPAGPGFCSINGLPVYYVNPANRNLVVEDTDFSYKSIGPDVDIKRTYNAFLIPGVNQIGMFGNQWRLRYEWAFGEDDAMACAEAGDIATFVPKKVYFIDGDGIRYDFEGYTESAGALHYTIADPPGIRISLYINAARDAWIMQNHDEDLTYRFGAYAAPWAPFLARLESIADPNGNTLSIHYFENSDTHSHLFYRISEIVDAVGRTTTFQVGGDYSLCSQMTTPDGRTVTYQYDDDYNLNQIVDMLGTVIQHAYSDTLLHMPMTRIQVGSKIDTFAYNDNAAGPHTIASVTNAEGHTTGYASPADGITTRIDALNRITTFTTTAQGFVTHVTNARGDSAIAQFNDGRLASITRTLGGQTTRTFDPQGNLTQRTNPNGFSTNYAYDPTGHLLSRKDALGNQWTYTRDAKHNITGAQSPLANATAFSRNPLGQVQSKTDALGRATAFEFDAYGNITKATNPAGKATAFEYDTKGLHCTAIVDPVGRRTQFQYDANDRLTKMTLPDGSQRSHRYLPCSWISTTFESGTTITVTRDMTLHVTAIQNAAGKTTHFEYDPTGRPVSRTDPTGKKIFFAYDPMNRLMGTTSTLGTSMQQTYDGDGNITAVTDGKGGATHYRYDPAGRVIAIADPLGSTVTLTRDPLGRVTQARNGRGQTIGFEYDAEKHLVAKTHDTDEIARFTYNAAGRMTQMRDPRGITAFLYDPNDTISAIRYYDGTQIDVQVDDVGRAQSIAYPAALTVNYTYDTKGRVSLIAWNGAQASFTYSPWGDVASVTRSNGTNSAFTYDDAQKIQTVRHEKTGTPFATIDLTRNDAGRVTNITATLPAQPALTPLSAPATYNAANQIATSGGETFTYDADGNLTAITGPRTWTASYDAQNRPTQITRQGVTTRYEYNALGYRTRVTVGSTTVRNFHLSHLGHILFVTDAWDNLTASFIYASGRPIAMWTPSAGTFFYHYDHHGNTIALTDESGNIAAQYAYTPYGLIAGQSGDIYNPFTFSGQYAVVDDGAGLYFMTNRLYDAQTGRFLHRDPIGQRGGVNLYLYAGADPANRIDPLGLQSGSFSGLPSSCGPMTEEDVHSMQNFQYYGQLGLEVGWNWVPGSGLVDAARHGYAGEYGTAVWDLAKFSMGPLGSTIGSLERLAQELPQSSPEEIEQRMNAWKKTQDRLSGRTVDPGDFPDQPTSFSDYTDDTPVMVEGPPE